MQVVHIPLNSKVAETDNFVFLPEHFFIKCITVKTRLSNISQYSAFDVSFLGVCAVSVCNDNV